MKGIAILSLAAVLAGCAGTGAKPQLNAAFGQVIGSGRAMVTHCVAKQVGVTFATSGAFTQAASRLLRGYRHDPVAITQAYTATAQRMEEASPYEVFERCQQAEEVLPAVTEKMVTELDALAAKRAQRSAGIADALVMFTQAFGDFNQSMSTYNANTAPAYREQPQPDFGQPESDSEHILINTEDGQVLCTAVNGSYAHCY